MNNLPTKAFIDSLKKWDILTKDKQATDLLTLSFLVNFKIGIQDSQDIYELDSQKSLQQLEKRILELIKNQKIDEVFLISSLTKLVTNTFKNKIMSHGDSILFNEMITNNYPESLNFKNSLERVKAPDYHIRLKNDYYRWIEVSSIDLSEENFDFWERELILNMKKGI